MGGAEGRQPLHFVGNRRQRRRERGQPALVCRKAGREDRTLRFAAHPCPQRVVQRFHSAVCNTRRRCLCLCLPCRT